MRSNSTTKELPCSMVRDLADHHELRESDEIMKSMSSTSLVPFLTWKKRPIGLLIHWKDNPRVHIKLSEMISS